MSDVIDDKIKQLKEIQRKMDETIISLVRTEEAHVLDLVKNEQLFQGFDSQGRRISPPYAPQTIKRKLRFGQPTDRVTLKDTGRFYFSFFIEYDLTEFSIQAEDEKTVYLVARYGPEILGLDQPRLDKVSALIKPKLLDKINKDI